MKNLIKHIFTIILVSSFFSVHAQEQKPAIDLHLRAKCYDNKIVLRWAYSQLGEWRKVNEEGFRIERITLDGESNIPESDRFTVVAENVKPWTRNEFQERASIKDSLAVGAYALLYDSLALSMPDNILLSLKEKGNDERRRAAFSMYLADQDALAATALGLRFEDNKVEEGKKYVYRIFTNNAHNIVRSDTANTIIKKTAQRILTAPLPPVISHSDSLLTLKWKQHPIYAQWHVERSEDGKNFKRINRAAIVTNQVNPFTKDSVGYVDENLPNYKVYLYRLTGIDFFGDTSEPSMVVAGVAKDKTAPNIPALTEAKNTEKLKVELKWDYLPSPDLKGFLVLHSNSSARNYAVISPNMLNPTARNFTHLEADEFGSNAYKIVAVDQEGNMAESFPIHAIIKNQAPPDAPMNVTGAIDSTGVVRLSWSASRAIDVKGYVVYKANADHHRYIALNGNKMVYTENFNDTISLNTLTEQIYYKVQAVDMNYAHSVDSKTLILSKPDTVAPVSPVIDNYKVSEEHIYLHWRPSSSNDVLAQTLIKTRKGKEVERIPLELNQKEYRDKEIGSKEKIQYQIIAKDDAGNYSPPSSPVFIKTLPQENTAAIEKFDVRYDKESQSMQLSWKISGDNSKRLAILRAEEDGKSRVIEHLPVNKKAYVDKSVIKGKNYTYSLALYFKDGGKSVVHYDSIMNIPN